MPSVVIDFCDGGGPIPAHEAVAENADYRDLPYFVQVATVACGSGVDVDRFVISYFQNLDTTLTARDVWFLVGDEKVMPVLEPPPCPMFRTYGNTYWTPWRGRPLDLPLAVGEYALWARNWLAAARSTWPRLAPRRRVEAAWLPLGMPGADAASEDVPPLEQRPFDIGFRGSLGGGRTYAPRTVSRQRMVSALERLPAGLTIDLFETESFNASYERDPTDYAQSLRDTKICLVPRGGSLETYRTFEAAVSGCVLITEPLPAAWYYAGLPRRELRSWSQLPDTVRELVSNPELMRFMSDAGRRWAQDVVSPEATGRWVANQLRGGNRRAIGEDYVAWAR